MIEIRAPGRVNLIGEHTDYNDGFVMPAAIGFATHVRAQPVPGRRLTIRSAEFADPLELDLDALAPERRHDWTDYARGIAIELRRCGIALCAADVAVSSSVPLGAGLSSSASFEIGFALTLLALAQATMPPLDLARLAQRAEVEHVGARSGIMDQTIVLLAKAGTAMLLDTRSLAYEYVPIPAGACIVIANSMVKHALAHGEYNRRREECEAAVETLQANGYRIAALRDVTAAQLPQAQALLPPLVFRRVRHVVTENQRVEDAAAALRAGNLQLVGGLMNASHESLRDDYEVSCPELDRLVEIARAVPGVYGARMTGGGFGGCTVNLVDAGAADALRARLAHEYAKDTGIVPDLYDGTPVDGAAPEKPDA